MIAVPQKHWKICPEQHTLSNLRGRCLVIKYSRYRLSNKTSTSDFELKGTPANGVFPEGPPPTLPSRHFNGGMQLLTISVLLAFCSSLALLTVNELRFVVLVIVGKWSDKLRKSKFFSFIALWGNNLKLKALSELFDFLPFFNHKNRNFHIWLNCNSLFTHDV